MINNGDGGADASFSFMELSLEMRKKMAPSLRRVLKILILHQKNTIGETATSELVNRGVQFLEKYKQIFHDKIIEWGQAIVPESILI